MKNINPTKKLELSFGEVIKIRSINLTDISEEHDLIDIVLAILNKIEEKKSGEEIINTIISELPKACYCLISCGIVDEVRITKEQVEVLFNLQDQITLITEILNLSIPDFKKIEDQKNQTLRISEQMKSLISRFK